MYINTIYILHAFTKYKLTIEKSYNNITWHSRTDAQLLEILGDIRSPFLCLQFIC